MPLIPQPSLTTQTILPPQRRHVQPAIGIDERIPTSRVAAVAMIQFPVLAHACFVPTNNEHRVARLFAPGEIIHASLLHVLLRFPVVQHRRDSLILRDVEIVIETRLE